MIVCVPELQFIEINHVVDRYGIIAARRALARIGFPIVINRGLEWWM